MRAFVQKEVRQVCYFNLSSLLEAGGIDELVREGTDYWEGMKHEPDVAAMKMRSRSLKTKSDLAKVKKLVSGFYLEILKDVSTA